LSVTPLASIIGVLSRVCNSTHQGKCHSDHHGYHDGSISISIGGVFRAFLFCLLFVFVWENIKRASRIVCGYAFEDMDLRIDGFSQIMFSFSVYRTQHGWCFFYGQCCRQ
jgi:hypothetical protein